MSGHAVSVGDNRGFFMTFRSESARVRHSCIFRRWRLSTAGIERRHGASSSYRAGTGTARAVDMARSCNQPHDIWKTRKNPELPAGRNGQNQPRSSSRPKSGVLKRRIEKLREGLPDHTETIVAPAVAGRFLQHQRLPSPAPRRGVRCKSQLG